MTYGAEKAGTRARSRTIDAVIDGWKTVTGNQRHSFIPALQVRGVRIADSGPHRLNDPPTTRGLEWKNWKHSESANLRQGTRLVYSQVRWYIL